MRPGDGQHGNRRQGMGRRAGDQARAAVLLVPLLAGGCAAIHPDLDVPRMVRNAFGAHLEGREPPPGLDQPFPNLATVPARPVPPDRATRTALSEALAQDRERSRTPLEPSGAQPIPEGPPAPPRLVAAAPIPRGASGVPLQAAPPGVTPDAAAPPAAPSPELLAPPPAPGADLLAPRR